VESLLAILAPESLVVIVPALAVLGLIGFLVGRAGRRALLVQQDDLRQRLERAERQTGDQSKRTIAKMRRELDTVANLALALPRVVRDLNRDDVDPADVPRLILRLADAVFEPKQVMLYGIRGSNDSAKGRVLSLSAHRGLDSVPEELKTVPMGHGKIGWVAKHELDMLKDDWDTLRMTDGLDVPHNHPALKADVLGPLIHHTKQGKRVMGVLCIGGPRIRPRDEKLMFQMVTNFGSLALVSTWSMSRLRTAAHHDGLTSLLNKRCFLGDIAGKMLVECESSAKPFSMFIFDIYHFKNFNDTNGHPAGDDLLRRMGTLIREHLRPGDVACRYGGEEFLIGMPNTDRTEALEQADRLRHTIETEPFEHREAQPSGKVSVSGGVAAFPKDGSSVSELIQHADQALYRSKKGGRNSVSLYKTQDIGDPGEMSSIDDLIGADDSAIHRDRG